MKLILEVSEQAAREIVAWANTPHRIFVTSSVPALHMWEVTLNDPPTTE